MKVLIAHKTMAVSLPRTQGTMPQLRDAITRPAELRRLALLGRADEYRRGRVIGVERTCSRQFETVGHCSMIFADHFPCRFRILDSSIPMVQPAKNWIRNNVSEPLD